MSLLAQAEECIGPGQYDPLLLLVLVLENEVLEKHTPFGKVLLDKLQPLFVDKKTNREALLQEARDYAEHRLAADIQWRLDSQHMPDAQYNSKKKELLDEKNPKCAGALCPTLLQLVYRSGARRHCLIPKWTDALHTEALELLLDNKDLPFNVSNRGSRRPLQVIEFPNKFQGVHKLYVDWDRKLSDLASLNKDDIHGGMQLLQKVRQAALGTPAAMLRILGEQFVCFGEDRIHVLVKEGTRKTDEGDWKISFHFVFQVLLSTDQFQSVYRLLQEGICKKDSGMKELASCLFSSASARPALERDEWWSGLIGVDMHPSQNAFQGLACLGSRKKESNPPSILAGRMLVERDGSAWEWQAHESDHHENTCASSATTVDACNNTPDNNTEKKKGVDCVSTWLEASVIMPSHLCVGASVVHRPDSPLQSKRETTTTTAMKMTTKGATTQNTLWRELLLDSGGLMWFRDALGGRDAVQRMFVPHSYTNIQNISKPKEVSKAANNKLKKCPPWALVHISGSDACICSCRLCEIPFEKHKKHERNGVVYCLFGNRVFVSCMDADCKTFMKNNAKRYDALSSELDCIRNGKYDPKYLLKEYGEQLDLMVSRETSKLSHMPNLKTLCTESHHIEDDAAVLVRAIEGSVDASLCMLRRGSVCTSATGERYWVELTAQMVQSYAASLKKRNRREDEEEPSVRRPKKQFKIKSHGIVFASKHAPLLFMKPEMFQSKDLKKK